MNNITEDELVALAFRRLPIISSADRESVERGIRNDLQRGFSIDDAIKLAYYSEEVSPHFEEEFALRKMSEIYHAERNAHIVKQLPGFIRKYDEEHTVQVIDTRRLHD